MHGVCLPTKTDKDFSKCFMYSVHQLHSLVHKHLEQSLIKGKAITFSQFLVLIGFTCSPDTPLSQSSIAKYSHITEATVSRHISTLVALGHLLKEENKENRRKHRVTITKKGLTAFTKAEQIIDNELLTIFSMISEKDRTNIMKIFNNTITLLLSKK